MKKIAKSWKKRLVSIIACMVLVLSATITSHAAGIEDLDPGITEMGDFVFYNNNTSPAKTVNGSHVTINVAWRRADGLYGAPNADAGLGDVKLSMRILDANTGNALTGTHVFYYDGTATNGYVNDEISLNVTPGQKIQIWMDASSVNPSQSNGKYRSIYIRDFWALVTE